MKYFAVGLEGPLIFIRAPETKFRWKPFMDAVYRMAKSDHACPRRGVYFIQQEDVSRFFDGTAAPSEKQIYLYEYNDHLEALSGHTSKESQRQIDQKRAQLSKLEEQIGHLMTRRADTEEELAALLRRLKR